jgi:hypothetical protein
MQMAKVREHHLVLDPSMMVDIQAVLGDDGAVNEARGWVEEHHGLDVWSQCRPLSTVTEVLARGDRRYQLLEMVTAGLPMPDDLDMSEVAYFRDCQARRERVLAGLQ